jgi:hypothetical protein
VSERHVESLNETLKKLEAKFGERLVSEIRVEEVREWLVGLKLAANTRNKHRGYAGQVFNLAVDYGHISANPRSKISASVRTKKTAKSPFCPPRKPNDCFSLPLRRSSLS